LRTHARRFEAAVEALGLDSKRNERRLLGVLAQVRKRAGKVRDMDVLTGHASSLHVDEDPDCLVQLLEYLGSARYQHAKKLSQRIRAEHPILQRRLKRSSAHLQKIISNDGKRDGCNNSSNRQAAAAAEAAATALKLARDLDNPPTLYKSNLHPYPLKVKEFAISSKRPTILAISVSSTLLVKSTMPSASATIG
jgi:CHAD domain-containing protein